LGEPDNVGADFAIIIPALNEETHIGRTLAALSDVDRVAGVPGEAIVVDNGSTDGTVEIAERAGARVISVPAVSIATLRNRGVKATEAAILCFLDADCEVTSEWKAALGELIRAGETNLLTGAHCSLPPNVTWFQSILSSFPEASSLKHIATGNLIVTRDVFERINGFNPDLTTGEDYDFCRRARAADARMEMRPRFEVFHHGYPDTVSTYFHRQRWHGRGDYESWESFLSSKPAQLSIIHHVALLASLILVIIGYWASGVILFFLVCLLPSVLVAFLRGRPSAKSFPVLIFLFWVYLTARAFSFIDVHILRHGRRWR
jgi:glycosyltransferase involved in cell wall biosynthesis